MAIKEIADMPEVGWKRYDDNAEMIKYTNIPKGASNSVFHNSTITYSSSTDNSKVEFAFTGSKLRIISSLSPLYSQQLNVVKVDDLEYTYSQYDSVKSGQKYIVFELDGLKDERHSVSIIPPNGVPFGVDAIDIGDSGRLLYSNEKNNLDDIKVGDKIIARYRALTSGKFGSFMQIGTYPESNLKLPKAPVITPDGGFYFICVDVDYKGRKILVADRNIQSLISWDALNEAGVATKEGLSLTEFGNLQVDGEAFKLSVRLLTGGVSTTLRNNSEWTRYIVSGLYPGSDDVWNWSNIRTITSTTTTSGVAYRTVRGVNDANAGYFAQSSTNNTDPSSTGFRPVLVVESLSVPKETRYIISKEGQSLHYTTNPTSGEKEWITLPETVLTKELFLTHGMTDLSSIPESAWAELGEDFEILCFKEEAAPLQVKVTTETLYDEANKRYAGTGVALVESVDIPLGAKGFMIQSMGENVTFSATYGGEDIGEKEANVLHEIEGGQTLEVKAELINGTLDAVAVLWS